MNINFLISHSDLTSWFHQTDRQFCQTSENIIEYSSRKALETKRPSWRNLLAAPATFFHFSANTEHFYSLLLLPLLFLFFFTSFFLAIFLFFPAAASLLMVSVTQASLFPLCGYNTPFGLLKECIALEQCELQLYICNVINWVVSV